MLNSALSIGSTSLKLRLSVLQSLARANSLLGDNEECVKHATHALAVAISLGDKEGECRARGALADAAQTSHDYEGATEVGYCRIGITLIL